MKPTKAVIPCAGYGTRLLPWTKLVPKELLPVGSKPAIQYIVESAVESGVTEIILVCHPDKVSIADYFRPNAALRALLHDRGKTAQLAELQRIESLADITVTYQETPRGLGDAVYCARALVGDAPFLVLLPDVLIHQHPPAMMQLLDACATHCFAWGLSLEEIAKEMTQAYGVIAGAHLTGDLFTIRGAVEKPSAAEAPSNLGICGRYLLPPEIFRLIAETTPDQHGEIQLTDAIHRLAEQTPGCGLVCRGDRFDLGTQAGWLKACMHFTC